MPNIEIPVSDKQALALAYLYPANTLEEVVTGQGASQLEAEVERSVNKAWATLTQEQKETALSAIGANPLEVEE